MADNQAANLDSPLHLAAVNGERLELDAFLKTGKFDIDGRDEYGRTPLMFSAMSDKSDCTELLVRSGAEVMAVDHNGQTALHWAALMNSHKSFKILLSSGADPKFKDNEGRTPLLLSTSHPNSKCLSILIRKLKSPDLNHGDNEKMTALHWSAYYNRPENIKLLLKAGADIVVSDMEGKTALHWTVNNDNATAALAILEMAPSVINLQDSEGRTALHLAVAAGNHTLVDALTSRPEAHCEVSAVDMQFRTALHWAAVLGLSEIVTLLLDRGADYSCADAVGATPLHYAAQKSETVDCVQALLTDEQLKDVPDRDGRTAVMWAAQNGNYVVIQLLLDNQVSDVHACEKNGTTALHIAALYGYANCVRLLLQHGAQVNTIDAEQQSPLFRACERGHTEVMVTLLQAGADVNLADNGGRTPLHWAASGGHSYMCSALIQQGVMVDASDKEGRTALHCASYGGFADTMSLLLEAQANPNLQDNEGISSLHWACSTGNYEAVQVLMSAGAYPNHMEVDGDRLTPLDYAIIGGHQEIAQYLIEQNALTISGIKELAASLIQKRYREYRDKKQQHKEGSDVPVEAPTTPASVDTALQQNTGGDDEAAKEAERQQRQEERKKAEQRRKLLEMRQTQPTSSWVMPKDTSASEQSAIVQKERDRLALHRKATHAALVIQLAWRKYVRMKKLKEIAKAEMTQTYSLERGSMEWKRELAALIIQLAWRQYKRRKLLKQSMKRRRILHEWSPSVLAAKQRALVDKVYGQELKAFHYEPPQPKPMVRPAYMKFVPSPAALSYNFAIDQYHPLHQKKSRSKIEAPGTALTTYSF
ncbi:inversin-like [Dysidea avara]|uniref:inversin-like n=1 Tax=Dysidea avara TaxID=196820 RepID=UPI0033319B1E